MAVRSDRVHLDLISIVCVVFLVSSCAASLSSHEHHRKAPLFQLGEARQLTTDMLGTARPQSASSADLQPGVHPRVLYNASTWRSLVKDAAAQVDNIGTRIYLLRNVSIARGPLDPAINRLSLMAHSRFINLYDSRVAGGPKWNEYRDNLTTLANQAAHLPPKNSAALPLCAFWASVSSSSKKPFLPSSTLSVCARALGAQASVILAQHIVHCNTTCPEVQAIGWWWNWGRSAPPERWTSQDDALAAAVGHLALAYDILYPDLRSRERTIIRSAIILLVQTCLQGRGQTVGREAGLYIARTAVDCETADTYVTAATLPHMRLLCGVDATLAVERTKALARQGRSGLSRVARDSFAIVAAGRRGAVLSIDTAQTLAIGVLIAPKAYSSPLVAGLVSRAYNGALARAALRASRCGYVRFGRIVEEAFLPISKLCDKDNEVDDVLRRLPLTWQAPEGTDWIGRVDWTKNAAVALWSVGRSARIRFAADGVEWLSDLSLEIDSKPISRPRSIVSHRACASGRAGVSTLTTCALTAGTGRGTLVFAGALARDRVSPVVVRARLGRGVVAARAGCGAPKLDARGCWVELKAGNKRATLSGVARGRARWAASKTSVAFGTTGWAGEAIVVTLRAEAGTRDGGCALGGRVGAPTWVIGDGVTYVLSFHGNVLQVDGVKSQLPPVKPIVLPGGRGTVAVQEGTKGVTSDSRQFVGSWGGDAQAAIAVGRVNGHLQVSTCGMRTSARTRVIVLACNTGEYERRRCKTIEDGNEAICSQASGRARWAGRVQFQMIVIVVRMWRLPGVSRAAVEVRVGRGDHGMTDGHTPGLPDDAVPEPSGEVTVGSPATGYPMTGVPTTASPGPSNPESVNPKTDSPIAASSVPSNPKTHSPETNKPITASPVPNNPRTDSPMAASPVSGNPNTDSPNLGNPATDNPGAGGPTTGNPVTNTPAASTSVTKNPAASNLVTNTPAASNPVMNNPATNTPTVNNPMTDNPTASNPVTSSTATGNPQTRNPTKSYPPAGNPDDEDPMVNNPKTKKPTASNPGESPVLNTPAMSNPQTKHPVPDKPGAGNPATSSPVAGGAASDSPMTGGPLKSSPAAGTPTWNNPVTGSPHGSPESNSPMESKRPILSTPMASNSPVSSDPMESSPMASNRPMSSNSMDRTPTASNSPMVKSPIVSDRPAVSDRPTGSNSITSSPMGSQKPKGQHPTEDPTEDPTADNPAESTPMAEDPTESDPFTGDPLLPSEPMTGGTTGYDPMLDSSPMASAAVESDPMGWGADDEKRDNYIANPELSLSPEPSLGALLMEDPMWDLQMVSRMRRSQSGAGTCSSDGACSASRSASGNRRGRNMM